ncbi:MAG: HPr family phosphocarrier protein [Roseburia sp.]|nr:HPr family phosphocarrier protein [Roseburia sp.]
MVSQKVVIRNATGLHLRPAGILSKLAMQFSCRITFRFRDATGNVKSVLGLLGACVKSGDEIEISCDGQDEEQALAAIVEAVEGGLGEEMTDR